MPKIVLAYSRYHFDPDKNRSIYGTGYISSNLWKYLHEVYPNHEILFSDYNDSRSVAGLKDVDLFIGLSQNFQTFVKSLKPEIACLWSVNKSSVYRQSIRQAARENRIPSSKLVSEDGINSNIFETLRADYVVTLGGWSNYKSFTDLGMKSNSVYALGIGFLSDKPMKVYRNGKNILMFMGTLSFRKGLHLVEPMLKLLRKSYPETKLFLVGRTNNAAWQDDILRLQKEFPDNFIWEKRFIEPGTNEWEGIFSQVAFGVFPSFEEGAAGALVQIIHEGVPVLYSDESGFEFTENSIPMTMRDNSEWLQQIENFLLSTVTLRRLILVEQQALLNMNGIGLPQIRRVLTRISQGALWPGVVDSSRFIAHKENSTNNEFQVLQNATQHKSQNILSYTGSEPLSSADLVRLGVMTLDKYPSLIDLEVSNTGDVETLVVRNINNKKTQKYPTTPVLLSVVNLQKSSNLPLWEYSKGIYRQSLGRVRAKLQRLYKLTLSRHTTK